MLCIHGFGNDICIEGSDFAVIKFNVIYPRVNNEIIMGTYPMMFHSALPLQLTLWF